MPQDRSRTLAQLFEQTDYDVSTEHGKQTVRIGAPCPAPLKQWLCGHCHATCAWIITAHNPKAKRISASANNRREAALKAWLDSAGHRYVTTDSRARAGDWPSEPGVCVLDMDEGLARALALRFDQAAMVALSADGGPAQLVWIEADPVAVTDG